MSDLCDAVQTAIFNRLTAGVTRAGVYPVVPAAAKPPHVVVRESQSSQIGGKGSDAERHDVPVAYIVAGTSKRALFLLMQQGKTALHDQVLTAAGFSLSRAELTSSSEFRDAELGYLVGIQNYTVFAQPV